MSRMKGNPLAAMMGGGDTSSSDDDDAPAAEAVSSKSFESDDSDHGGSAEAAPASMGGGGGDDDGGGGGVSSKAAQAKIQALQVKNKMLDDMVTRLRMKTKQQAEEMEKMEEELTILETEAKENESEQEENERLIEDLQFTIMRLQAKKGGGGGNDEEEKPIKAAGGDGDGEDDTNHAKNRIREFQAQIRMAAKKAKTDEQIARELQEQREKNRLAALQARLNAKAAAASNNNSDSSSSSGGGDGDGGGSGGGGAKPETLKLTADEIMARSEAAAALEVKAQELSTIVEELQTSLNEKIAQIEEKEASWTAQEAALESQLATTRDRLAETDTKFKDSMAKMEEDIKKVRDEKVAAVSKTNALQEQVDQFESDMATAQATLEEQRVLLSTVGESSSPKIFQSAIKEGALTKCGSKVKSWKKRFFTLTTTSLRYYDPVGVHQGSKPTGEILLVGSASVSKSSEKPFAFQVSAGNRTLILYSSSAGDTDAWVKAIKEVCSLKTTRSSTQGMGSSMGAGSGKPPAKKYFGSSQVPCKSDGCTKLSVCRSLCQEHYDEYAKKNKRNFLFKDSVAEGLLIKMGGLMRGEKERYFALSKGALRYYKPENIAVDSMPVGQVSLGNGCVVELNPVAAKNQQLAFAVTPNADDGKPNPGRTILVYAHHEADADEWVRSLKRVGGDDDDDAEGSEKEIAGELVKFTRGGKGKHIKYFTLKKNGEIAWGDTRHQLKYNAHVREYSEGLDGCDTDKMGLSKKECERAFTIATTSKELLLLAPTPEEYRAWLALVKKCKKA